MRDPKACHLADQPRFKDCSMRKGRFTRKAHPRRLPSGRVTPVREALIRYQAADASEKTSYFHPCRKCGATILTRRLPNGGWAHFEGKDGLGRVKHPCQTLGAGLSRRRDPFTLELFTDQPAD
ncbi:hypothetical protein RGR602_PA00014 (plasmid) [Rhizobium gallicum bv. gallicum R602sp]|uniref:Uncharacterized protein n=2 Tax=Rhizobium TaxID=379 RepID=A0A0B4X845_9HYPH|nr:hypothetical protein RGR602_PA00014 [Rhizobium gallicum bv. gallicum R602sp]